MTIQDASQIAAEALSFIAAYDRSCGKVIKSYLR